MLKENLKGITDSHVVAQRQSVLFVFYSKEFHPSDWIQVEI